MQHELDMVETAAPDQGLDHSIDYHAAPAGVREQDPDSGHHGDRRVSELVEDLYVRPPLSPSRKAKEPKGGRGRAAQNFKSPPVADHGGMGNELRELRL